MEPFRPGTAPTELRRPEGPGRDEATQVVKIK